MASLYPPGGGSLHTAQAANARRGEEPFDRLRERDSRAHGNVIRELTGT
jgi:hypothetical protein